MADRYFAWVRLATGKPIARAHVRDRVTGEVVASCGHEHKARHHRGYDASGQRRYTSGTAYAERCARRLLRAFLASAGCVARKEGE